MLRGGSIVATCILGRIVFKRPVTSPQMAGVGFAIVGFVCVGLSGVLQGSIIRFIKLLLATNNCF